MVKQKLIRKREVEIIGRRAAQGVSCSASVLLIATAVAAAAVTCREIQVGSLPLVVVLGQLVPNITPQS